MRHLAATATGITALVLPSGFVHVLSAADLTLLVLAGLGIAAACALGPPPGPPHPRRPPPCTPNDMRRRHSINKNGEVAQSGGSVRARCDGLRYGPEPFGAHY